ncbi:GlxA family transcriptional regulator [Chitinophaga arvensicola]|uniref:Transcriptional regulator GlxA family, contains an amidase domain and an AraC-type DNA-binding HTH domain n=1 Tax=Chitinophaga arvensicola TaxID=29529 RepID=A0A1I0S931_9BACT|nr:helix-turn-helix domain-containing protein [Chitinophaga arvensicola]SEW52679.1 Transcriptional regulator GlxA family, contains an amidase domain and an AraC-type DNA-binding HTH domain [Chitinophaga arvensicola]
MIHISILVPLGHTSVVNIEGSYQILSDINNFLREKGREPMFQVQLAGLEPEVSQRNRMFTIAPEVLISDVKKTDLIIIPSLHGDQRHAADINREFIPWIQQQYQQGAAVASLCLGAFFLAATGLLDGKPCATHWKMAAEFRAMFPNVLLMDDRIITEEDRVFTSGGAYSYLNLLLYLVEKYAGRDIAILTAKAYGIDFDRQSQSPFIIFEGQKTHNDEPIRKIQEFIEASYQDKITVEQLSDMSALGRRSFERRFKKSTGNTVIEYIQRIKIEAAKRDFETSSKNINEVIYDVGYIDTKTFRTIFKKVTGLTPLEYRNKYNKQTINLVNE